MHQSLTKVHRCFDIRNAIIMEKCYLHSSYRNKVENQKKNRHVQRLFPAPYEVFNQLEG